MTLFSTEFLITSLVVVLIPGTGVVFTVSVGLSQGRRASFYAALGCTWASCRTCWLRCWGWPP